MTGGELRIEADGAVRIVTIHRPEQRNATDASLHTHLANVWGELEQDRHARSVVLTGAGEAFCAGGDLAWLEILATDHEERRRVLSEARAIITGMTQCGLPVVAAVNGAAVGLGFSLAMLCDLVYAAESAYFADPHVPIGLTAADGAAMVLPFLTSLSRVKELLLLGGRITATDAHHAGMVNRVLPHAEVLPAAIAVAHRLAAQPVAAVRSTKRALNASLGSTIEAVVDDALAAESECFTTDAHRDAVQRLAEQRPR